VSIDFENLLAQKIKSERSLAGVCEVKAADLITKNDAGLAGAWSSIINNDVKADDSPEANMSPAEHSNLDSLKMSVSFVSF